MKADTPNPGSLEARKQGCTCPVLDNSHGKGYMGITGLFVFNESCPVHSGDEQTDNDENQ